MALSTLLFVNREQGKKKHSPGGDSMAREARVSFEDFVASRYHEGVETTRVEARSGYLLEPNMLELFGDVRARTVRGKGRKMKVQEVRCETATAYFDTNSLAQMMTSSRVDRVDLKGFVQVKSAGMVLDTDQALYEYGTGLLHSNSRVSVAGPAFHFRGEGGFTLDTAKENLNVSGPIKGAGVMDGILDGNN
ncbi:MAG: hypothetical protein RIQ81_1658 [Pseudomonadota bacterium]